MGGPNCEIDVKLTKPEGRKPATIKDRNQGSYKAIVFQDGEDVKGQVLINLNKGKRLDHLGIRVELVGIIENLYDKNQNSVFLQLVRDLEPPGALNDNVSYDFQFNKVEKQYETYNGIVVRTR